MIDSNGIIREPVNVADPYYVMGIGQYNGCFDLVYISTHEKINRWSRHKPILPKYEDTPTESTDAAIELANYGINVPYGLIQIITNGALRNFEWTYTPPVIDVNYCRLTDFKNYNHKAIRPMNLSFPKSLHVGIGNSGRVRGIDASFDEMNYGWFNDGTMISVKEIFHDSMLDYRFSVCAFHKKSNGSILTWYVTEKMTLREKFEVWDYAHVWIDMGLNNIFSDGMEVTLIYFLSMSNMPAGGFHLMESMVASLEYLPNADRRTYTITRLSATDGLTTTIEYELNTYVGQVFYIENLYIKVEKEASFVNELLYLELDAGLASEKSIVLLPKFSPVFVNNVYEKRWTRATLPSTNEFILSTTLMRDSLNCYLYFAAGFDRELLRMAHKTVNY